MVSGTGLSHIRSAANRQAMMDSRVDSTTAIGRAIIHHNDFIMRIGLLPYAFEGLQDQRRTIIGGNDD